MGVRNEGCNLIGLALVVACGKAIVNDRWGGTHEEGTEVCRGPKEH